jgi:O-antigen/teichoic acid export membrane protein
MLASVIFGMIINLLLNIILIPSYKHDGAAVANVLSELAVTFGYMFFCFKVLPFKISQMPLLSNFLATVPFIAISMATRLIDLNVYAYLAINLFAFGIIYVGLQATYLNKRVVRELILDLRRKKG